MGSTAQAAWPEDVSLSQLGVWEGERFTNAGTISSSYQTVVQQLGVAIANSPVSAVESSGLNGFDVALTNAVTFTDSSSDGSPWQRVHEDAEPGQALWIPSLSVRKGLPLSLEAGARLGYVGMSHQTVFGGWGKATILEGYRKLPDVAIQYGYSGYIGNTELALGTQDFSAVIGKTFPFGHLTRINTAQISPYIGGGIYRIRATPRIDDPDLEELGVTDVSGFTDDASYTEGYAPGAVHMGVRVLSGDVQVLLGATIVPNVTGTLTAGLGYAY